LLKVIERFPEKRKCVTTVINKTWNWKLRRTSYNFIAPLRHETQHPLQRSASSYRLYRGGALYNCCTFSIILSFSFLLLPLWSVGYPWNALFQFNFLIQRAAAHQLRQDKHQDMRQKKNKSWRQHHDSDRCAAVFIISFVSTVLISLRHVADIESWLLHVLTHAGVRPT
jgi:hypothetical protein